MMVPSSRLTNVWCSFSMVDSVNPLYLNRLNGCTMWDPGSMRYAYWVRRVPRMALVYFIVVRAFAWHSFFPVFPSVRPPHWVLVTGEERNSLLVLFLPIYLCLSFWGSSEP